MKSRALTVTFPVFSDFEVRVILSHNFKGTGRRLGTNLEGDEAAWVTRDDNTRRGWLVIAPKAAPGTVAHEASHAIRTLFRTHGVRNDDEAFAYHLDYLVGRIHKFLDRG